jgi:uncharacterized protein YjiS (DUF1127 family)
MRKLLVNLLARYRAYVAYRNAVHELSSMSDRELQDIGISRYDISNVARQTCKDCYSPT